jgi:hypothetical protein
MIKNRYGVVHDADRNEFEKAFQIPYGYKYVSFKYEDAKKECDKLGNGYVVDEIVYDPSLLGDTNKRQIIYSCD